jgi:hypothetical protein
MALRLPARSLILLAALVAGAGSALALGAAGCGMSTADTGTFPTSWDAGDADAAVGDDAVVIEVGGGDGGAGDDHCGTRRCDPDRADICTPVATDAGGDAEASADAPKLLACRVIREGGDVVSSCAPAGEAADSAFCASDDDCKPGLACVGDPGRCLPYCCGTTTTEGACDKTRYCALLAVAARPADRVPVCAPLDNCPLLQDQDHCPAESACTVVRNDGATTCVPIGTGRDLQACPCDRGYVCLGPDGNRLCRKLCRIGDTAACGAGTCQALSTMPTGFGICTVTDAGI